jgi:methylated-DNA-[protein]-cysteine S-methyltransferase
MLVPRGTLWVLREAAAVTARALATTTLATPLGVALRVTASETALVAAEFVRTSARPQRIRHAVLADAASQVRAYFARRLRRFDVALHLDGTPFEVDVWRAVAGLWFGEIVSYADVARAVGRPHAHRGVASAMSDTPIDLFIPAHRVIGADGRLRGCSPRSVRARLFAFETA